MPLISCWTKTSMRPPCPRRGSPLCPGAAQKSGFNQILNRGLWGRQRCAGWPNRNALLSNPVMEPNGELAIRIRAALGVLAERAYMPDVRYKEIKARRREAEG